MFRAARVIALTLAIAAGAGFATHAQAPGPGKGGQDRGAAAGPEAVARAFFDALARGSAAQFEAMAQERFAPETLARRTPAERAQMLERIRGDFGTLTLVSMQSAADEQLTLNVTGSTGVAGRIEIRLEGAPPYRITSVGIEVGEQEAGPPGPPPPPINGSMTRADLDRALDAYLAARAQAGEFAGVVAIAKDGKVVFQKAYGLANREAKTPVMASTRFNIASIGKAFTKTAVGQLVSQGRIALTDTIGKWLPDYPNAESRAATVDQLLNHQAGIADFFGPAFAAAPKSQFASNADYYRFVSVQAPLFAPGTQRQYCNGCYVVLGEIVAKASGQPYEAYIAEHVFKPAVMFGAGFFRSDRLPAAAAQQVLAPAPRSRGRVAQRARRARRDGQRGGRRLRQRGRSAGVRRGDSHGHAAGPEDDSVVPRDGTPGCGGRRSSARGHRHRRRGAGHQRPARERRNLGGCRRRQPRSAGVGRCGDGDQEGVGGEVGSRQ